MRAEVVVEALAVAAGLAVVLAVAGDATSTLVITRRRRGRFWPTPVYYRWSWRAWRAAGRRARPERREGLLTAYGPLSLLGLLVLWVLLLVGGWAAVWWELRPAIPGLGGYLDLAVVLEATAVALATIEGARSWPAARLWRRATRLLQGFRGLPAVGRRSAELAERPGDEAGFRDAYRRLERLGLPLHPFGQAWDELRRLRAVYRPELLAATEQLLVPLEFRHQSARLDVDRDQPVPPGTVPP